MEATTEKATKVKNLVFPNAVKGSTYAFNPFDLAIQGGKDTLSADERGPLDTDTDKSHPLYDERLKTVKLTPEWVSNINTFGVKEVVEVVKIGDKGIPFLVNGRTRVRAARVATKQREKEGLPPVMVEAKLTRLDDVGMLRDMISLNIHFEDSTATKIAKLKRLMERGVSVDDCANVFGIRVATAKAWLAYDDTAIPAVKKAVNAGKIPSTTGMDIARLPSDKQESALDRVMALSKDPDKAPKRGGNAAKAKRAIAEAAGKNPGISDRKTMKRFLTAVENLKPGTPGLLPKGASADVEAWWDGVEAAVAFVLGSDGADKRLIKLLSDLDAIEAKAADKEEKPSTKGKKVKQETPTDDE
jgi:ParB family chromosome partitioning protein